MFAPAATRLPRMVSPRRWVGHAPAWFAPLSAARKLAGTKGNVAKGESDAFSPADANIAWQGWIADAAAWNEHRDRVRSLLLKVKPST